MSSKNEFSFLFPAPKLVCLRNQSLDIQSLCFPLEICKKYDFLFEYFAVKNKNRGLEIIFQETKTLADEEYTIECGQGRMIICANAWHGQFYALATLLQILAFFKNQGRVPDFFIKDAPEVPFRGFMLDVSQGVAPLLPELQRLLLKLALLKFNYFSLGMECLAQPENAGQMHEKKGIVTTAEIAQIVAMARKTGIDVFPSLMTGPAACSHDSAAFNKRFSAAIIGPFQSQLINAGLDEGEASDGTAGSLGYFLDVYRFFKNRGKKILVWGDVFLQNPELIRKIPQDVLVLNREYFSDKIEAFKNKARPFKKHHISQVLCPATWNWGRFIPAMRRSMANITAAFQVVKEEKLAGVMLTSCADKGDGTFLEGLILPLFQAGNLFWSGQSPRPDAFSLWALGQNEPDLFRVYTFLAHVDNPLQHTHRQYLFEDPLFATFSRQDNVKEIVARFRKASLYLKKRKIVRSEMSDFLNFAQHLYELIADKVEFSNRLLTFLTDAQGDEKARQRLERLLQGAEKLKNLFINLWLKRCKPDGLAKKIREFDSLQERFHYLLQASAHPAARKNLIFKLKNYSPDQYQPDTNYIDIFGQY